jgi:hypothetical protein
VLKVNKCSTETDKCSEYCDRQSWLLSSKLAAQSAAVLVVHFEISLTSPLALLLLWLCASSWLRKDLAETNAVCHKISHSDLLNVTAAEQEPQS